MGRVFAIGVIAATAAPHALGATMHRLGDAPRSNATAPVEEAEAATVANRFWNGVDTPAARLTPVFGQSLVKLGEGPAQAPEGNKETVNVQVFGLQHSGTDLLNALLRMNFQNQIAYYAGEVQPGSTNTKKGYFVHANVKEIWRIGEQSVLEGEPVKSIAIIRNPMAWLALMKSDPPIELADCVKGDDWLDRPCLYKHPGGPQSKTAEVEYPSIEAIWNQWNDGFEKATEFGFSDRMMIPYESMVRNPKGTLDHVANFLGLKPPASGWTVPDDKNGEHGREEVLRFMYKKEYMKDYVDKEIWTACGHLDKGLQRMYGYDDCEKKISDHERK